MSNILIFPLPELGHILPTLVITRHLTSLGHKVVYFTAPQFGGIIASAGGVVKPMVDSGNSTGNVSGSSIWYRFVYNYGTDHQAIRFRQLMTSLLEYGAFSLVLCDRILGQIYRDILISRSHPERTLFFSTSLFNWNEYEPDKSNIPTLVFCPDILEVDRFRMPRRGVVHVESCLRSLDSVAAIEDLQLTDDPIVVATFGTQDVRYRSLGETLQLIEQLAAKHSNLQFAVATGPFDAIKPISSKTAPSNLIVRQRLPQRLLLKRAAAIITHGGLGTVKEAIFEGVPMIVLPVLHDQPFNALRVRYNHIGEAIFPEKLSLQTLSAALERTVAGAYASTIARMQVHFVGMEKARLSNLFVTSRLASCENASRSHS